MAGDCCPHVAEGTVAEDTAGVTTTTATIIAKLSRAEVRRENHRGALAIRFISKDTD